MADSYIGFKVRVKLQNGVVFEGVVSEISGTVLRLINVFDSAIKAHVPSRLVDGSKIAELEILSVAPGTVETATATPKKANKVSKFHDPAVLNASGSFSHDDSNSTLTSIDQVSSPLPKSSRKQRKNGQVKHIREPSASYMPQPFAGNGNKRADKNGWASEDTAGFKDMEFDFQGNLDRFDKKSVFDEIRQADTTDPGARLVSFNKRNPVAILAEQKQQRIREFVKRPPKRDFLPSENVLNTTVGEWQDISSEDDETESTVPAVDEVSEIDKEIMQRRRSHVMSRSSSSLLDSSLPTTKTLLYDGRGRFECPTYTLAEINAVERMAVTQYSLHSLQLTENAGAAIAKQAIAILGGKRRFERRQVQTNALPVVVVLVGNHETGARAVAGARALVNRRVRVVVLLTDHSSELAAPRENVEQQIRAFKAAGGKVTSRLDVLAATLKVLDAPPELVIDGLQGLRTLNAGVPGWMYETVQWAATQRAAVLAIDVPAGVDPDTGVLGVSNMGKAKWVLALGMPAAGIARYMQYMDEVALEDVGVSVADIGLPLRCFKKALTGDGKEGVAFESEWSVWVRLDE
ncbi:YjeF N-terminal domain-containing protein [Lipomyces arxii]|uniref:YjeF N-terminal domain-containing protein n=1 Tax=Lipomyces arxii TaxID=56418 RepID=UPI0034CF2FD7